ncbi:GH25 family lysozyme [uncultured Zoogloea sp.]|uniref:glycoside hydrolase family 25 protein n=1 Tax=uncultured Zoogloea sp. TaxID=160237 RepID=UPI0026319B50|nr:GH25 family lysozyme [uncultured Zoogloea sp.]
MNDVVHSRRQLLALAVVSLIPKVVTNPWRLEFRMSNERLHQVFICAAIAAALATAVPFARAQANGDALTDDLSRGQRFDLMLSDLAESPALTDVQRRQFAFPLQFAFPHDARFRDPLTETNPRSNQIFGIDLSHHNTDNCRCEIDWVILRRQDVQYAYLKVSQGVKGFDPLFTTYRKGAKAVAEADRIPTGGYHFLSADGSAQAQAANFVSRVGSIEASELPPVLDLEEDNRVGPDKKLILGPDGKRRDFWDTVPADEILSRAVAYLKAVEAATGRAPIIYTNAQWWKTRIGDGSKIAAFGKYKVWTADYSRDGHKLEKPSVPGNAPWALWQFTSTARMTSGGVGKGQSVDANVFNGTLQQFRVAMGVAP